jgi:hypothetical protein
MLLPVLFYNGSCQNGVDENHRNVHVRIVGSGSASACDIGVMGGKGLTLYVYAQEFDQATGRYKTVSELQLNRQNTWDDGFEVDFSLEVNKPYRIFVQGIQNCSQCCGIGGGTQCTEPPSFLKNARLYFYGERTIGESENGLSINVSLQTCDCRC